MACYVEQGVASPTAHAQALGANPVVYSLTSGEDGTELTGYGYLLIVTADTDGWFHVASAADGASDKAAATKTHRILTGVARSIGDVGKGMFISFLADA